MDRTFHQRFTIGAACGIVLLLLLAAYFFWVKAPIVGVVCALLLVVTTERTLHKVYIFHDDKLTIYYGKLGRRSKTISLGEIESCRPMTNVFGLVRYLLLAYGDKVEAVQPDNERAFVECLKKRRNEKQQ